MGVVLVAGALAPMAFEPRSAEALKPGGKVTAKVNDGRFKSFKKATAATVAFQAQGGVLSIVANSKPSRKGIKNLSLSVQVDLNGTLPVTVPAFLTTYSEGGLSGITSSWGGEGVTVTISSYKRSKVKGTFEGMLPPAQASGPATITRGKFKVNVLTEQ